MTPWSAADPSEYLSLDLRAHEILRGIPLHDVWALNLPGGGDGRTLADIRSFAQKASPGTATRILFSIRWALGRLLGWDREPAGSGSMFEDRLTESDRANSVVQSGTKDGPFTVLYVHQNEAMSEVRNSTVHAALVWVLTPREGGYRMLWAIYVKPVGRFTAFYMALINPFRRWIVYPSLLKSLHREWRRSYGSR